jgi:hypothetical protein
VSLAATVSRAFRAGEWLYVYVVCYRHSPRVIQLGISSYLSSQGEANPSPVPWPSPSALSDGASFILVDATEGIKEENLSFPPAVAEIHADVSFNDDSLVRSPYADDPDLVHLVSVADLRRAFRLTALDFSWFAFEDALSFGSLSPLEGEHPPSGSLSREPLAGKLPWGFIPRRDPNPALHTRDVDHYYRHSWVQPSHFCEGGGMGLFFYTPRGQVLPAGTLLGVYSGRSDKSLKIKYKEAQKLFRASDYVVDHSPSSYVVDGKNRNTICGPARSNDNFDIVNCHFAYNPLDKRVKLFTNVLMSEGYYEALTKYDTPGKAPCYWSPLCLSFLSPEARPRCLAYYCPLSSNNGRGVPIPASDVVLASDLAFSQIFISLSLIYYYSSPFPPLLPLPLPIINFFMSRPFKPLPLLVPHDPILSLLWWNIGDPYGHRC